MFLRSWPDLSIGALKVKALIEPRVALHRRPGTDARQHYRQLFRRNGPLDVFWSGRRILLSRPRPGRRH